MKRETSPDRSSYPIPRRLGRPRVAVLLVAVFLPLASAFAGGGTRILEGRVVDAQGRPLPGVTVSAGSVVAVSDALGTFRLLDRSFLNTVTATFVLDGFESVQFQGELRVGQPTTIEVTMTLAAVTEELIVTAQAPIVDSSPTRAGEKISEDLLDALPQVRSFASYLQLLPGRDGSPSRIQAVGGTGFPITDIYEASTPAARLYSTDSILLGDLPPATSLELLIPFLETTSVVDLLLQTNPIDLDLGILPGGPPTRIGPSGSFYGPPDLGGNGFLAAANLDSQLFDVYDLFIDPPRMVGSFSSGGFQNSLFTGGHDPALDFSGGEIRGFFDRAPSSDVRDLGNGCTQFYPFSELVLKRLVWDAGSGQFVNTDTRSLGTRPGPFGPGCYDVGLRTDVFRIGDWSIFQYRRGNLLSFQPYDGTMLGSAFTAMLPAGYEQIEYVPNSYADQTTGIALTVLPDGIWEIAEDGLRVGIGPSPAYSGGPLPRPGAGSYSASVSVSGTEASLLGNFTAGSVKQARVAAAAGGTEPLPAIVRLAGCADTDEVFCGLGNRFSVRASWRTPDGGSGTGHARPLSGDSGTFWFFERDNRELLVKTLDACAVNGHYWFFAGGLTDLAIDLTVQDRVEPRGRLYSRPGGAFQPILDTTAFPCSAAEMARTQEVRPASPAASWAWDADPGLRSASLAGVACGGDENAVCLNEGRFRMETSYQTTGDSGPGVGGLLTADTGVFSFFEPDNFEIVGKLLDACGVNGRYWSSPPGSPTSASRSP